MKAVFNQLVKMANTVPFRHGLLEYDNRHICLCVFPMPKIISIFHMASALLLNSLSCLGKSLHCMLWLLLFLVATIFCE
jgi:hypothetical protein